MKTLRYLSVLPFLVVAACGDNASPPGSGSSSGGSSGGSSSGSLPDGGGADAVAPASIDLAVADATVIQGSSVELTLQLTRGSAVTGDVSVTFGTLPVGLGLPAGDLVFKAGQTTLKVQLSAGIDGKQGDTKLTATAKTPDGAASAQKAFTVLVRGAPGTLDKTFGTDGALKLPTIGILSRLEVLADGSAFVAGPDFEDSSLRVVRMRADGTVDAAYGVSGAAQGDVTETDVSDNIVVRPDGSVFVSGRFKQAAVPRAFRFGPTGAFQLGMSLVGDAIFNLPPTTSMVATSQHFYLAGSAGGDTYLTRYSLAGVRDAAYNPVPAFTNLGAMAVGTDGLVTMCGSNTSYATFDLSRLDAAGNTSPTINLAIATASAYRRCNAIAPRKSGGFIVGLNTGLSSRAAQTAMFAATNAALQLDSGYGSAGAVAAEEGRVVSVTEDALQRVVGVVVAPSGSRVVRLTSAGAFDASFGSAGRAVAAATDSYVNAKVLPSGRILVAGIGTDETTRLYRLWP